MSAFTILCTANAFRESAAVSEGPILAAGGEVLYTPRMGPLTPEELIPYLQRADAVIASTDPYNAAVLAACPRVRAVVRWGTGYDSVDLNACTDHGVVACNTPGLVTEAVADYVLMVMLGMARKLEQQVQAVRGGGWAEVRGVELFRKTVGLAGFGVIGRAVARRLRGFECRILAYDPMWNAALADELGAEQVSLERLFAESDFVSLHAAVTPESRNMVNEGLLRRMKPMAYLVNASRGALVDEAALVRALSEGWLAGAAIDTYTTEPIAADHPLRRLPNCLATPHNAFNTIEAAAATNRKVAEVALTVLRGERPQNVLNPAVYESPALRSRQ